MSKNTYAAMADEDAERAAKASAFDALLAALRTIARFPHAVENRDLTYSEAVSAMAETASAAIAKAEAVR